jgi:type II secretory pathway component GspD/PulD (secretin)
MKYRTICFLLGLLVLDIITAPMDELSRRREVRGQTDNPAEVTGENNHVSDDNIIKLENGMSLIDLIKTVSEINKEPCVIDGSVKPKEIRIITPEGGMEKSDVLLLFDTVLRLNGLAVVKSDGINKIVNIKDISAESTPVETDKQN